MATGAPAVPPLGFIGFCLRYRTDCVATSSSAVRIELTPERRGQLEAAQEKINRQIHPSPNPQHIWDDPGTGYGDCNNYAIAKRAELIAFGWPREALLLTAAITPGGEGHLVLVAATKEGDLVLDNLQHRVVDWRTLPYRWVERQSEYRAATWVSIVVPSQS
jgi:predicted transglutaminase-like cysteine proteinase